MEKFQVLNAVPVRELYTGALMPAIGLGTFGSDHADAVEIATAVGGAFEAGYRHFDCAAVYGNEKQIGTTFRQLFESGVNREDLWVTSKVWNDMHGHVEQACRESL